MTKFYKASFGQFKKDFEKRSVFGDAEMDQEISAEEAYENILLPVRATKGSAGYDFRAPFGFTKKRRESPRL